MTPLENHVQRLLNSFKKWTGRELIARSGDPSRDAAALFDASFIIVSHGTEANPVLNYGNRGALDLWEMDWERLTRMPSRETAEPMHRDEREEFMNKVRRDGFVSGYGGVRISSSGKRFRIEDAVIWNVLDEAGNVCGQAAMFKMDTAQMTIDADLTRTMLVTKRNLCWRARPEKRVRGGLLLGKILRS